MDLLITAFIHAWPWAAIGLMAFTHVGLIGRFAQYEHFPWRLMALEACLGVFFASCLLILYALNPYWVSDELIWTLLIFLSLSTLELSRYWAWMDKDQGKSRSFSAYLGNLVWVTCLHAGGFLSALSLLAV